ncbi:8-oxo-dGTP pyrophosphatase MutT (NUDIX family) [Prauserella sediminis]|uniref:8-oxo-dGTP pyrophosphatase MutT (NUDIX family) n=1 Tax=Prauserella sediminis TaxID=577680 RepID=A0A839XX43_9PSEU|nr:NUDIX domain-containing protein [Prauserella sediminis]MBB3665033.1 8-oxo-dGTP pyrophosphatase MutT (NUDIX family) [Prauserella sediminis]
MLVGNGDGFVSCDCGRRHWGLFGAAGLLLSDPRRGVLLQHRADWTHEGGPWALPGGAVQPQETSAQAAARETEEETAVSGEAFRVLAQRADEHGSWRYTTVLATAVGDAAQPRVTNAESTALRWVSPADVADYPLHSGFAAAWPELRGQLDRRLVLLVDADTVLGARPGRPGGEAGAVPRLRDRLTVLAGVGVAAGDLGLGDVAGAAHWTWWPHVVLVGDGPAAGGSGAGVELVDAGGTGDGGFPAVVRRARAAGPGDHLVAVTADDRRRGSLGAGATATMAPDALWRLLDACTPE